MELMVVVLRVLHVLAVHSFLTIHLVVLLGAAVTAHLERRRLR